MLDNRFECACTYDQSVPERDVTDNGGPGAESAEAASGRLRGVITDWGGVLTNPIAETVNAWLNAEGIERSSYLAVMRPWMQQAYAPDQPDSPIHRLERGECSEAEFERQLAAGLVRSDGGPVAADGLLARMFAAAVLDPQMPDVIRGLRAAGMRTALLSNSWGSVGYGYPRHLFPELFDAVVISAEVGMRKPEPRIFALAAELIGLRPRECVFIDDIEANVEAAEAAGLVGVHHQVAAATAQRLSELLGLEIAGFAANPAASHDGGD